MKKLFLLLSMTLFFSQCGYEKIYSDKNLNLSIRDIKKENNSINNELSNSLLKIFSNDASDNVFDLEIQTNKSTEVRSKNSKGDPTVYVLKLETKIIVFTNTNKKYENIFYKEMNYNNNDDKFELSQYINEIEKTLINETVGEIINYLTIVE